MPSSMSTTVHGTLPGFPALGSPFNVNIDPFEMRTAHLQADNAKQIANINQTPARLQMERFNQVFPWLQGQMGGVMGSFGAGGGGQVENPQQLQQQINQMRSQGNMQAATQNRLAQRTAASRGLGAQSPLTTAIQGQNQQSNLASQTGTEANMRLGAQQANAQNRLAYQQMYAGMFPGLLNAMSGLV